MRRTLAFLSLLLLFASCERFKFLSQDGICARMPFSEGERAQITEISIRPNRAYGAMAMKAETDYDMIDEFYDFLLARKDGWRAPVSGVPEGTYIVSLSAGSHLLTEVGIGPGYVSAPGCEGYNYMRDLSPAEMRELERILQFEISPER